MRNAFAREIVQLAAERPELVLLSGDIGNRLFDSFKADYADRFFNCGVAEANMISVAAGMAMCGLRPVAYTIAPFITTRCLEQIRVDVCYHRQPVVIVGVGGGLSYANLGATHHSCEDIAIMRSLPEMQVVCPADAAETRAALKAALDSERPTYLRIGKKGEPDVHAAPPEFQIGRAIQIRGGDGESRTGEEIVILAVGNTVASACEAAEALEKGGERVSVFSMHTLKPLDRQCLRLAFAGSKMVCTLEEHSIVGGLGSAVAEWLIDERSAQHCHLLRIGVPDAFFCQTGSPAFVRRELQIDAEGVRAKIAAFSAELREKGVS